MLVAETTSRSQLSDGRFEPVDKALKRLGYRKDVLIEVLHIAQGIYGYLSDDTLVYIASQLRLPPSYVYGVATFYHLFNFAASGKHNCTVCMGTACYVKAAPDIVTGVGEAFGIEAGQTTPDGELTLTTARCIGSCGLAPAIIVDGEVLGREGPDAVVARLRTLLAQGREQA